MRRTFDHNDLVHVRQGAQLGEAGLEGILTVVAHLGQLG